MILHARMYRVVRIMAAYGRLLRNAGWMMLGSMLLASFAHAAGAEFTIDSARTVVRFQMQSLGTVQRGGFNAVAGTVLLDHAGGEGRIDIVIDARSVELESGALTGIVRGPGMLNVDAHPRIEYQARRMVFDGGRLTRIEGELTLRGVTRDAMLTVTSDDCSREAGAEQQRCSIIATADFKRSAFGMTRYRMLASDEVQLVIHAEGVRVPPEQRASVGAI